MPDIESHTVCEEDFAASSRVGNYELSVSATREDGPTPNEVLLADYASCFSFAIRAGADRELDLDLGKIEIEASADENEDDDLADGTVSFTINVEADLTNDEADEVAALGQDICHVHASLREELHADIEVDGDAF